MAANRSLEARGEARRGLAHLCSRCHTALEVDTASCPTCEASRPEVGWSRLDAVPDPWLGRVIDGDYLLTRRLGKGTFGAVYCAQLLHGAETYAMKVIDLENPALVSEVDTRPARERVRREVQILSRVRSPHVVRFYDYVELPGSAVGVVTNFVHGQTLQSIIDTCGELSQARAVELTRQIAIGLSEVHSLGAIHRDIKPANILVEQMRPGEEFIHIIDFGIVRYENEARQTAGFLGTPLYASPEQAKDEPVDHLGDIYSLGVMLFFMLAGRPPFLGSGSVEVLSAHIEEEPPAVSAYRKTSVIAPLEELVGRMLAKQRERRPQSMEEVAEALGAIGDTLESKSSARDASSSRDSKREHDRRRAVACSEATTATVSKGVRWQMVEGASGEGAGRLVRSGSQQVAAGLKETATGWSRVLDDGAAPRETNSYKLSAFSADGDVAFVDRDEVVYVHRAADDGGEPHRVAKIEGGETSVTALSLHDGELFVGTRDGALFSIDVSSKKTSRLVHDASLAPVDAVAKGVAGSLVVAATRGQVHYRPIEDERAKWSRLADGEQVVAVAAHEAAGAIAVGRTDGAIEVFNPSHSTRQASLVLEHDERVIDTYFSSDGYLLGAFLEGGLLKIYSATTGQLVNRREVCRMKARTAFGEKSASCPPMCRRAAEGDEAGSDAAQDGEAKGERVCRFRGLTC